MSEKIFICGIGAQKSGTTWLSRYLRKHPQVYVPYMKEMHFFDSIEGGRDVNKFVLSNFKRRLRRAKKELKRGARGAVQHALEELDDVVERFKIGNDVQSYLEFMTRGADGMKAFADITPAYSVISADSFRLMYNLTPNTRFVFIMRNPVERYRSGVDQKGRLMGFDGQAEFLTHLTTPHHVQRTSYDVTLARLEEAGIPEEHMVLMFFEEVFDSSGSGVSEIQRMCEVLGIDFIEPKADFGRYSGNKFTDEAQRKAAVQAFGNVYQDIYKRFGDRTPQSWIKDMEDYL